MLTKEHFKLQMKRMRETGKIADNTHLILPSFMAGTNAENFGVKSEWLQKLFTMMARYQCTDEELTGTVDLAIMRKARGIINYFPTDDELRRLLFDWREIHGIKSDGTKRTTNVKGQTRDAERVNARQSHLMMISCVDCRALHRACDMCPKCYAGMLAA